MITRAERVRIAHEFQPSEFCKQLMVVGAKVRFVDFMVKGANNYYAQNVFTNQSMVIEETLEGPRVTITPMGGGESITYTLTSQIDQQNFLDLCFG